MNNITRRNFLIAATALGISPTMLLSKEQTEYIIAPEKIGNKFSIGVINLTRQKISHIPIAHEGHVVCPHPNKQTAIMCAQRPGKVSYYFDYITSKVISSFSSTIGYHFYGHGIFMNSGKEIWMTETSDKTGKGKIVVRSVPEMKILREFQSQGYAPHELKLLDNNKKLVIANGGNVKSSANVLVYKNNIIESSLNYYDTRTEKFITGSKSPANDTSIRHLDVHRKSQAVIMCLRLYSEEIKTIKPIAFQEKNKKIDYFDGPESVYKLMNNLCLSVTINQSTNQVAFTSPQGHVVTFWDFNSKKYLGKYFMKNTTGVTYAKGNVWVLTSDSGEITFLDDKNFKPINSLNSAKYKGLSAAHVINTSLFS